jgi:ferredoxin
MALKITKDCTNCGACETECPNFAIFEGKDIFEINPDLCSECVGSFDESQCVLVCPADSIILDENKIETKEELLIKYKKIHKIK